MSVDLQGDADVGMPQTLADHFDGHAMGQPERRHGMAEVVNPEAGGILARFLRA